MKQFLVLLFIFFALSQEYQAPKPNGTVLFIENFNTDPFVHGWVSSKIEKFTGVWKWSTPLNFAGIETDKGLLLTEEAKHYAVSKLFPKKISSKDGLVIQYEVKFETASGLACGGAYIKIFSELSPESFSNDTPYTLMFGPDKCGSSDKVHFIIRHQNPISKEWEEKHMENPPSIKNDVLSHLYTLVIKPDNTFEIFIDQESVKKGSLLTDFQPSFSSPQEIDDSNDKKPTEWVDEEEMDDAEAKKPQEWDENEPLEIEDQNDRKPEEWDLEAPKKIADPKAVKPKDWVEEEDGKWEAPLIDNPQCLNGCGRWSARLIKNPNYKGKWIVPKIKNPNYKGKWAPKKIQNPNFYEEKNPSALPELVGVGLELWTMTKNILFDNFLISKDYQTAEEYGKATWAPKFEKQKEEVKKAEPEAPNQLNQVFAEIKTKSMEIITNYPIPILSTLLVTILT